MRGNVVFPEAGLPRVHTPGLVGNGARKGIGGGDRKSDPKGSAVIAERDRMRPDPRAVGTLGTELRLPVSRRRARVTKQTARAARLRDLRDGFFPALERRIDPTPRIGLGGLSHDAAPEEIRAAGAKRIIRSLTRAASGQCGFGALQEVALRAAQVRSLAMPGRCFRAERIADTAAHVLLKAVAQAVRRRLAIYADAARIGRLPWTVATPTAAFIARIGRVDRFDAKAAAAGLAPVLR